MAIISVVHDEGTNTLTITLPGKTVQLVYASLPGGWEADPSAYQQFLMDYLNGLIETRTDARTWHRDKDIKNNDPEYYAWPESERMWIDTATDKVVFAECVVVGCVWNEQRQQYVLKIRNTDPNVARV